MEAREWWDTHEQERPPEHICDFTVEELELRHKEVLGLIEDDEYDPGIVGTLIMGDYYLDGFGSRSCCSHMAGLIRHDTGYLTWYCGSSKFFFLRSDEMLGPFWNLDKYFKARAKDDRRMGR